jgi:hypothetical protein
MSCRCFRYLRSSWTLALSVSLARALQGVPSVRDPGNLYDRDEQYVLNKAQRQERAPVRLLLNSGGRHFSSLLSRLPSSHKRRCTLRQAWEVLAWEARRFERLHGGPKAQCSQEQTC